MEQRASFNIFQEAKQVDAQQAVIHYLGEPNRIKKWLCPFHTEQTASFSRKGRYFRCFGCNWRGDIIDLVAELYNVPLKEAATIICRDFGLTGPGSYPGPETREQIIERERQREREQALKRWREAALKGLSAIHRNAAAAVQRGEHLNNPGIADLEVKALHHINILSYGSVDEQLQLYKSGSIKGLEIYGKR